MPSTAKVNINNKLNIKKMNEKELKTIWKLAKSFWIAGTLVWVLETIIFLIIEGWHYRATNPIEMWFDKVVGNMWNFALWLTIVICVYYIMNLNKKNLSTHS